ncbi:MAG: hypothetical protein ABFD25_17480 [Clostridiaceae bacterium]
MKKYVAPKMVCVDLRAEERVCECTVESGECVDDQGNLIVWWEGANS